MKVFCKIKVGNVSNVIKLNITRDVDNKKVEDNSKLIDDAEVVNNIKLLMVNFKR